MVLKDNSLGRKLSTDPVCISKAPVSPGKITGVNSCLDQVEI